MLYLELFLTFFKIGLFTIGGGYAMLPLIQADVQAKGWMTAEELVNFIAVSESTPGPFAVNVSTYVGAELAGLPGAFCATLGVVLPSFLMIAAISLVLQAFERNRVVQYAFAGIRAGVLALICKALVSMYRQCPRNLFSYLLAGAAFWATAVFRVNVLLVILGCAACGLVHSAIVGRKQV